MDFTFELAKMCGKSPFYILAQDKDEVIMIINYLVEKDAPEQTQGAHAKNKKTEKNERVRVNDKTATGGWF